MTRAEAQEAVVTLYLRLNGYFTSGFIVHSDVPGENKTELDVLAVRFPHNAEPVRGVNPDATLDPWDDGIDFIIGEVKSHGQRFQFNRAVRESRDSVATILQWWGHLTAAEVQQFTDSVVAILAPQPGVAQAPTVACPRNARVRAVLFSPEENARRQNQSWFIPGPPMFAFIWKCFRPPVPRDACATVYDFGQWGHDLEPIVRYFKDANRQQPGDFRNLLTHLGVAAN
jgi:hypothetical protein